jgi:uncharacterized protein (DUF427 family)
MKATLYNNVIAESDDTVSVRGYDYFPLATVRTEWLEKAPRTPKDLECPHGVQFYDVVEGRAQSPRAAWSYEAPQAKMQPVDHWIGFWNDVAIE